MAGEFPSQRRCYQNTPVTDPNFAPDPGVLLHCGTKVTSGVTVRVWDRTLGLVSHSRAEVTLGLKSQSRTRVTLGLGSLWDWGHTPGLRLHAGPGVIVKDWNLRGLGDWDHV